MSVYTPPHRPRDFPGRLPIIFVILFIFVTAVVPTHSTDTVNYSMLLENSTKRSAYILAVLTDCNTPLGQASSLIIFGKKVANHPTVGVSLLISTSKHLGCLAAGSTHVCLRVDLWGITTSSQHRSLLSGSANMGLQ